MRMYNPELDITLDKKEVALKFNTCIPEDIEEFEGWYKLYYEKTPHASEYQKIEENAIKLVDGKYTQTFYVMHKSVEDIKEMRINEVYRKFTEIEQKAHIKSSLGFTIDANEKANRDIEGLIDVLTAEGYNKVDFRDYDNNFQEVSLTDLETMRLEVIKNGQYIYQQKWEFLRQIEKMDNPTALIALSIEFQNMEFGS